MSVGEAQELDVDWNVVEKADGSDPGSQDWKNLLHLVSLAQPKIEENLLNRDEHLLLVHPGQTTVNQLCLPILLTHHRSPARLMLASVVEDRGPY